MESKNSANQQDSASTGHGGIVEKDADFVASEFYVRVAKEIGRLAGGHIRRSIETPTKS